MSQMKGVWIPKAGRHEAHEVEITSSPVDLQFPVLRHPQKEVMSLGRNAKSNSDFEDESLPKLRTTWAVPGLIIF
jgi:hypothetical protein